MLFRSPNYKCSVSGLRDKIWKTAIEMNYVPNEAARNLKKGVTAMRRKLKKLAVKVENEEADYDNVENMFRGWMGGHYKLLSREQRKNLIQLYEDLFSKEIAIVNKKLIVSDRSA